MSRGFLFASGLDAESASIGDTTGPFLSLLEQVDTESTFNDSRLATTVERFASGDARFASIDERFACVLANFASPIEVIVIADEVIVTKDSDFTSLMSSLGKFFSISTFSMTSMTNFL